MKSEYLYKRGKGMKSEYLSWNEITEKYCRANTILGQYANAKDLFSRYLVSNGVFALSQ